MMNIGYLKNMIEMSGLPDDAEVFVACQGYCNYDFKANEPYYKTDTFAVPHDGKLFIIDECAINDGKGGTI